MTEKTFIIAEAGVNHNGDVDKAIALIDLANKSGADSVKFQSFNTDRLTTKRAATCNYQKTALNGTESQQDMLRKLELNESQFTELSDHCKACDIEFMSTAFDVQYLDFLLEKIGIKRIKIPSGEMMNPFLLLHAARSGLPIIMSTGIGTLDEIRLSLGVLAFGFSNPKGVPTAKLAQETFSSPEGAKVIQEKVTILHCTSNYPAKIGDINLKAMQTIKQEYGTNIGLSDHSEGTIISVGAVALGASVIEKHFTLDKEMEGPDHKASLSPNELNELVIGIRNMELALGNGIKEPTSDELANKTAIRGSLVALKDIALGDKFSIDNLTAKRPGDGLNPMELLDLHGKTAKKEYQFDDQIDG